MALVRLSIAVLVGIILIAASVGHADSGARETMSPASAVSSTNRGPITLIELEPLVPVEGEPLRIEVFTADPAELGFAWFFRDENQRNTVIDGAAGPELTVAEARVGTYSVVVTGPTGDRQFSIAVVRGRLLTLQSSNEGGRVEVVPPWVVDESGSAYARPVSTVGYPAGSTVRVLAVAAPGYEFEGWINGLSGLANPADVLMDQDRVVTAGFRGRGGTVWLGNRVGPVDAPLIDGLAGLTGIWGQFYGGWSEGSLSPVGDVQSLTNGYLPAVPHALAGVAPGQVVYLQLRVWDSRAGPSWEAANEANGRRGVSGIIAVATGSRGTPPSPAAYPIGLQPFSFFKPPRILSQPRLFRIGVGADLELGMKVEGTEPLTYQWCKEGREVPGANAETFRIHSATDADAGVYTIRLENAYGSRESATIQVEVYHPPVIRSVVIAPTPAPRRPVRVEVSADGTPPFFYDWYRNDILIRVPEGSSPVLELEDALGGDYRVVVTGHGGSDRRDLFSVAALHRLSVAVTGEGSVAVNPPMDLYPEGSEVEILATAPALSQLAYWTGDASGSSDRIVLRIDVDKQVEAVFRERIGGTLLFANRVPSAGVEAPVFDEDGTTRLSGERYLTQLYGGPSAGWLLPLGEPQPFREGAAAGYLAGVTIEMRTGEPGDEAWVQMRAWDAGSGATYERALEAGGKCGTSGVIRVRTGGEGSPPSLPGFLTGLESFRIGRAAPPSLVSWVESVALEVGAPLRLVTAAEGTPPLTFQWQKDGMDLVGADDPVLEVAETTPADSGGYTVRITNPLGSLVSPNCLVLVTLRTQTIDFPPPEPVAFGQAPVPMTAAASSGLPVDLAVVSGRGRVEDGHLVVLGAGEVRVEASQAGNDWFAPAAVVERVVEVAKATAPLRLSDLEALAGEAGPGPTVETEPPGLAVEMTFNGETERPTAPGDYQLEAWVEDADYEGFASAVFRLRDPTLAVGGWVFEDRDGDRVHDVDEAGLAGAVIRVSREGQESVVLSDGLGQFVATGLAPGVYQVELAELTGYLPRATPLQTVSGGAGERVWTEFGAQAAATIEGIVFQDLDGDGLQNGREPGLAGVRVRLVVEGEGDRWVTSDAEGTFRFDEVPAGSHYVEENDPIGFESTTPHLRAAQVQAGGAARVVFGDRALMSISGVVFEDLNGNGRVDEGEPGVGDLPVQLVEVAGEAVLAESRTDAGGSYRLTGLSVGAYRVRPLLPETYVRSVRTSEGGRPALHSSGLPRLDQRVDLAEGASESANFAVLPVGRLTGVVFVDWDGDGAPLGEETRLAGVGVELRRAEGGEWARAAVSGIDGVYRFEEVPAGTYLVSQAMAEGWLAAGQTRVTIEEGGAVVVNLANRLPGSVTGRVFQDENGNGICEAAEPGVGRVAVRLRHEDGGEWWRFTAGDGSFAFTQVPPGGCTVEPQLPDGLEATTPMARDRWMEAGTSAQVLFGQRSRAVRAPELVFESADLTVRTGEAFELAAVASGTPPLRCQWSRDGVAIPGATNLIWTADAGLPPGVVVYEISIVNALGTVGSRPVRVTVLDWNPVEQWLVEHGLPEGRRGPGDDPDGDGLANAWEYFHGTDPLVRDQERKVRGSHRRQGGEVLVGLVTQRAAKAGGLSWRLERSSNLMFWEPVEAVEQGIEPGPTGDWLLIEDPEPLPETGSRFLRLRLEVNWPGE